MYIALSIVALAAFIVAAGFLYQVVGAHRDRRRFASPGRWVDIGADIASTCSKRAPAAPPSCLKPASPPPT
jgi:hypothetical protein